MRSFDGVTWVEQPRPPWRPKYGMSVSLFKDTIFASQGADKINDATDRVIYVATIIDQYHPIEFTDNGGWQFPNNAACHGICAPNFWPVHGAVAVEFKGRLWILGGANSFNCTKSRDIWYSDTNSLKWKGDNGSISTWALVPDSAGPRFSRRAYFEACVLDSCLWVFGGDTTVGCGNTEAGLANDAWYSYDGKSWQKANVKPVFPTARWKYNVVAFNGHIWAFGGFAEFRREIGSFQLDAKRVDILRLR